MTIFNCHTKKTFQIFLKKYVQFLSICYQVFKKFMPNKKKLDLKKKLLKMTCQTHIIYILKRLKQHRHKKNLKPNLTLSNIFMS